jgi:cytochrome c2
MRRSNGAALAVIGVAILLTGCSTQAVQSASAVTGGEPQRGREAISKYGCGSCHSITGVAGAHGLVGPPLTGIASRTYVAGVLPNTPENIVRWIVNPKDVDPKTAMPELGVNQKEATDIAAYLYSTQ